MHVSEKYVITISTSRVLIAGNKCSPLICRRLVQQGGPRTRSRRGRSFCRCVLCVDMYVRVVCAHVLVATSLTRMLR